MKFMGMVSIGSTSEQSTNLFSTKIVFSLSICESLSQKLFAIGCTSFNRRGAWFLVALYPGSNPHSTRKSLEMKPSFQPFFCFFSHQTVKGYTIPPGHQVCVSPTVNQKLGEVWKDPEDFNPDRCSEWWLLCYQDNLLYWCLVLFCLSRFLQADASNSEKFSYVPFGAGMSFLFFQTSDLLLALFSSLISHPSLVHLLLLSFLSPHHFPPHLHSLSSSLPPSLLPPSLPPSLLPPSSLPPFLSPSPPPYPCSQLFILTHSFYPLSPSGRHRCVGESFAYIQIKTIWSVLLRKYEFDLCDGFFPPVNYSTMIHTPLKPIIKYRRRAMKQQL